MKISLLLCCLLGVLCSNAQGENSDSSASIANSIERNRLLRQKEMVGTNKIGDYKAVMFINDSTQHADKIKLQFQQQGLEVLLYMQREQLVLVNENGTVYYFAAGNPYRYQRDKIDKAALKRIDGYKELVQRAKLIVEKKEE